jgi:hypothetical protein
MAAEEVIALPLRAKGWELWQGQSIFPNEYLLFFQANDQ